MVAVLTGSRARAKGKARNLVDNPSYPQDLELGGKCSNVAGMAVV